MNDYNNDLKHIKLYVYKLYIYHICPFNIYNMYLPKVKETILQELI